MKKGPRSGPLIMKILHLYGTKTSKSLALWVLCASTSTVMGPVSHPSGTVTVMLVSEEAEITAAVPLKSTESVPWENPEPVMMTSVPGVPSMGSMVSIAGGGITVKCSAL